MTRPFTQVEMTPVYGIFHYLIFTLHRMFFRGDVAGVENIPAEGPFLLAGNHASHFDPLFIGSHVPRQLAFFARKTLWKGGIFSWWMDQTGSIPVDRDGGADVAAIKRVLRALQQDRALLLFPEGTRSADGNLQPPKSGVGMIACRARVPVVPVRIFGSHRAWSKGGLIQPGVPISIVYGAPLQMGAGEDRLSDKRRYEIASQRIMAAIARLERPSVTIL